jgi:D-sedoheptulose 7-phosphate isomerase
MKMVSSPARVETLERHIAEVRDVLGRIPVDAVRVVVDMILEVHDAGRHIYVLGNGGSASTASHFACDLSKATIVDGRQRLRVTALTDNVALLTAWANDTTYEEVFAEQVRNLVSPGDLVIVITASGDSPNVLAAIKAACRLGAKTVGLVGFAGGAARSMVDAVIHVPSESYGVVEDCHLVLEHAITASTRDALGA